MALVALVLGCRTPEDCAKQSRTECMRSARCALELATPGHVYRCRPAVEPCEPGLKQADFFGSGEEGVARSRQVQAACRTRPGCVFDPGVCYCHCRGYGRTSVEDGPEAEPCNCGCAGGPPPRCRATGGGGGLVVPRPAG